MDESGRNLGVRSAMTRDSNGSSAFRTGDFAAEIASLQTQFDVIRYLRRVAQLFGFSHFIIATVPGADSDGLGAHSLVSNLPSELIARIDALDLVRSGEGFRRLRGTTAPFELSLKTHCPDAERQDEADVKTLDVVLNEANLRQVNIFPVHDVAGTRAFLAFVGPEVEVPTAAVMELQMVAIHLFNRLVDISALLKAPTNRLSDREIQCLTWTAAGKTSSEIAGILGLSEHTVNHYLNHVTKKLDAVNRTQAVVKALKLGLIS
ncbi:DNA-binding transcriptional regulator, CsgD family [Rhizobium sp. RU20A]|uniref:helix-turn-helix transcriptional regulator n=1 Tax=Rhizobium sp. RU20A TaxID=1907412 RepID=UPI0009554F8F|nr:LuxR family transcriptional regulator [Rhizobium sp. RU20A]SIR07851.1 DNA-binding transcriptional regulator, CsgD family [Rhizobium sp. RU20A]